MKVVLFCGGLGLRLRDYADHIPKPMVQIGYRPILWHVMKYYAHFGHRDFILCLGYRGDLIKQYFLNYDECLSNDFVLSQGGATLQLSNSDIHDWTITFVDTGLSSNVGERLRQIQRYVADDDVFLANYSDGLTDLPLPQLLEFARQHDKVATFTSVRPGLSYHLVETAPGGQVTGIKEISRSVRINGGLFVLKKEIFRYMEPGEELVLQVFQRLMDKQQLVAYEYDGYYGTMDTFKDKQQLDDLYQSGNAPWEVWKRSSLDLHKSPILTTRDTGRKARRIPLTDRHA